MSREQKERFRLVLLGAVITIYVLITIVEIVGTNKRFILNEH